MVNNLKYSFIFLFLFLILTVSCSKGESADSYENARGPLKMTLAVKSEAAVWTNEVEGALLTEDIRKKEDIHENVRLVPETLTIVNSNSEKIYPFVEGFGSLDLEGFSEKGLNLAYDFCDALCEDINSAERLMAPGSMFSLVFFAEDLTDFFEKYGSSSDTNNAFSSYLIGQSFLSGDDVQVPVRLYFNSKEHYTDIRVFLNEKEGKIKQIKIVRIK